MYKQKDESLFDKIDIIVIFRFQRLGNIQSLFLKSMYFQLTSLIGYSDWMRIFVHIRFIKCHVRWSLKTEFLVFISLTKTCLNMQIWFVVLRKCKCFRKLNPIIIFLARHVVWRWRILMREIPPKNVEISSYEILSTTICLHLKTPKSFNHNSINLSIHTRPILFHGKCAEKCFHIFLYTSFRTVHPSTTCLPKVTYHITLRVCLTSLLHFIFF